MFVFVFVCVYVVFLFICYLILLDFMIYFAYWEHVSNLNFDVFLCMYLYVNLFACICICICIYVYMNEWLLFFMWLYVIFKFPGHIWGAWHCDCTCHRCLHCLWRLQAVSQSADDSVSIDAIVLLLNDAPRIFAGRKPFLLWSSISIGSQPKKINKTPNTYCFVSRHRGYDNIRGIRINIGQPLNFYTKENYIEMRIVFGYCNINFDKFTCIDSFWGCMELSLELTVAVQRNYL